MTKLIKYFSPTSEQSVLEKLKIKVFFSFTFVLIMLSLLIIVQRALFSLNSASLVYIIVSIIIIFLIANLFVLKYRGVNLSGNLMSVFLVLAVSTGVNVLNQEISVLVKYINGFYLILGILIIGALFASIKIFIFNAIVVFLTSTRVYLFGLDQKKLDVNLLTSGYIFYVITIALIATVIVFVIKFVHKAIDAANKDAAINKKQNLMLQNLIKEINKSSDYVFRASNQLSSISTNIAQNTSEQASTTEEISASMEEMLSIIHSNVDNAELTGKTTSKSELEMRQSNEIFEKTLNSVTEISETIMVITEIAGKTDLLSINAAIEAARSGESGKGFAVVADEIKKLASKTKLASEKIEKLSKTGQEISKLANTALLTLIPEIAKSSVQVSDIIYSSKEQEKGAEAINSAILQLSDIINNNSSVAEQMSVSAEELLAEAKRLKKLLQNSDIDGISVKNNPYSELKTSEKVEKSIQKKQTQEASKEKKYISPTPQKGININIDDDNDFEKY